MRCGLVPPDSSTGDSRSGLVRTVNVGAVRTLTLGVRTITTAIWKEPVDGRIAVRGVNLAGDDQADRSVHGGPDKAIYAYAIELPLVGVTLAQLRGRISVDRGSDASRPGRIGLQTGAVMGTVV
jgi:hypothetical protein